MDISFLSLRFWGPVAVFIRAALRTPVRRSSDSACCAAHGLPHGGWRAASPFAMEDPIRFPIITGGGGTRRTVLNSVCYIRFLYR
jgi:hypothetical protein